MKIGVFFGGYEPKDEYKCSGQITAGINEAGAEGILFTLKKKALEGYNPPFPLIQVLRWEDLLNFRDISVFIVYTWASPQYNGLVRLLKKAGKRVIVKADSDGRIGLSVSPRPHFRTLRFLVAPPIWKVPLRFFYPAQRVHDWRKIEQIQMVDALVVESPDAAMNVCAFLARFNQDDLISKIRVIPNPVTPDIVKAPIPQKENIIVAVGRWDDWLPKNPRLLVKVLAFALPRMPAWKAVLIGQGKEHLEKLLPADLLQRVTLTGPVPHDEMKGYLGKAKIFLASSRFESFLIAASEALSMGCTLVGTPLESFRYFAQGGRFGNIAPAFDAPSLAGALLYECGMWEKNLRNPEQIASFWRERLDRKRVGNAFIGVAEEVIGKVVEK